MRTQGEHTRTLQRRVAFLKAREHRNSYDQAELGALEWALVNLPPAQQEPVAWEQFYHEMGKPKLAYLSPSESPENACYIPPAQRTWVGLTDEEKLHIEIMGGKSDVMLAEMVEAKLKEKNT